MELGFRLSGAFRVRGFWGLGPGSGSMSTDRSFRSAELEDRISRLGLWGVGFRVYGFKL